MHQEAIMNKIIKKLKRLTYVYFWLDIKYSISAFFRPRQAWLTKKIPKTWCDKTSLIPLLLFECLVHYIEEEEGLMSTDGYLKEYEDGHISKEYCDKMVKMATELREAYDHIKARPCLEQEMFDAYPKRLDLAMDHFKKNENGHYVLRSCEELYGCSYKQAYAKQQKLETLLAKKDLKAMQTIVKYHEYLWT